MSTTLNNIPRTTSYATTLLASAARTDTAGTNGDAVHLPDAPNGYQFVLDVTAAATDVGDTLDVQVQTLIDGVNWVPVCSFTQCLGNGGAKRHIAKINAGATQAMFEAGTALAAGSTRNLCGDAYRVRWVIVDSSTDNASFTFSVTAMPL